MIKSFNPIKSRRPWPPISISHLFQQGPFSSWPLLFLHLGCFCLDIMYRNNYVVIPHVHIPADNLHRCIAPIAQGGVISISTLILFQIFK